MKYWSPREEEHFLSRLSAPELEYQFSFSGLRVGVPENWWKGYRGNKIWKGTINGIGFNNEGRPLLRFTLDDDEDKHQYLMNEEAFYKFSNMTEKQKLLHNLKHCTYARLGPSKVFLGQVGVIAFKAIPSYHGIFRHAHVEDPDKIIWLTREEVNSLPNEVKILVQDFILPQWHKSRKKSKYPIPAGGMNYILSTGMYCNSSFGKGQRVNALLTSAPTQYYGKKDSMFDAVLTSGVIINVGDEILLGYRPACFGPKIMTRMGDASHIRW